MFVLDTSIAACWCFGDEDFLRAEAALVEIEVKGAILPALF